MKVLLTGASGFLGRYVLQSLQRQGIATVTLGRQRAANSAFAEFIEADLLTMPDFNALARQARATHLLHLAWFTEHGEFWTSPQNLSWIYASVRLADAFCNAGGQRVVMAGSCAEYEWSENSVLREDATPLNSATLYGTTKNTTRRLVNAICTEYQVPLLWGRMFLLHGTGENRARLIPSLIDVFRGQRPPFGINAYAARDFLHATDVAEGFNTLLRRGDSGAYNICSGQPVLLGDVARELARLLDADPQAVLSLASARRDEPATLIGDNSKLKALGWQPALSLTQGLERTVREAAQ